MNSNPPQAGYTRAAHILVKPAGARCNLRCTYCFYLEKHAMFEGATYRMSDQVLETFTRKYIAWQNTPEIEFAWQGGEPTTLGVDFFRRAVELQKQYGGGRTITNSLQTNGTLLDEEWCEFLARENFLIGLSIDGPPPVHDRYRIHADGRGSYAEVDRAIRLMKRFGVEFNSLTCVTRESAYEGAKIYRFLRDRGVRFMQFIPIVERPPDARSREIGLDLAVPPDVRSKDNPTEVMPFCVEPRPYGQFLIDIFDEWKRRDIGTVFVNHFDVALNAWMGMNPPLCANSRICGSALAMEHDGTVYACDHFVYPEYRRGNVLEDDFQSMVLNLDQQEFGACKWSALPSSCKSCEFLRVCHGGCLKHRFCLSPEGEPGRNYLCEGFKLFYAHAAPVMAQMAELLKAGRAPAEIMERQPGRPGPASANRRKKSKKGKKKRR